MEEQDLISVSRIKKIAEIEPSIPSKANEEIDASGYLVSPPFVDAHFHMDATLSIGLPRLNQSGTLLEGIALWGELKPHLTVEAIKERALRYCDMAVARGLLAIRSHVDICDPRLLAVDALLEVKKEVSPYLDLQLVAFPQDGYFRSRNAVELLNTALDTVKLFMLSAILCIILCIGLLTELNSTSPIRAVPATVRSPSGLKNSKSPPISCIDAPSIQPTFCVIGTIAILLESFMFISLNNEF